MTGSARRILDESEAEHGDPSLEVGEDLPDAPIPRAVAILSADGWWPVTRLDLWHPADLCLLAEVCNWGAKTVDARLYACKPAIVAAARQAGATGGWGSDEYGRSVYYLYHPVAGESSYHDPHGEIAALLGDDPEWPHGWSGVERQHMAFDLVESRIGDGACLSLVAQSTTPRQITAAYHEIGYFCWAELDQDESMICYRVSYQRGADGSARIQRRANDLLIDSVYFSPGAWEVDHRPRHPCGSWGGVEIYERPHEKVSA